MSSHETIESLIIRYLQQEISEDELRVLDTWIHESDENKAQFFHFKALFDSGRMEQIGRKSEREASWKRMSAKIKETKKSANPFLKNKLIRTYTKYAAIILLAIGTGVGIETYRTQTGFSREIAYNEVIVEKGGRANTLLLSDGTKVVLNAATRFKYPASFNATTREVILDGEAYFEVAKNKTQPFVVTLNNQRITVLGTTFNIEAHHNDAYNIVTLLSGSIELQSVNTHGEVTNLILKPNEQAHLERETGKIVISKVDASITNAWTRGVYKFREEPLELIVRRLENYYGVKISLTGDSLKNIRYTGTFSLEQPIQNVLNLINYENQFSYTKKENEFILSEK